jgi:hypothetical protein
MSQLQPVLPKRACQAFLYVGVWDLNFDRMPNGGVVVRPSLCAHSVKTRLLVGAWVLCRPMYKVTVAYNRQQGLMTSFSASGSVARLALGPRVQATNRSSTAYVHTTIKFTGYFGGLPRPRRLPLFFQAPVGLPLEHHFVPPSVLLHDIVAWCATARVPRRVSILTTSRLVSNTVTVGRVSSNS